MAKVVKRIEARKPTAIRRLRVAAYARVSMESERLEHSLSSQISRYSEMIQRHPGWEYAGVFAEMCQPTTIQLNTRVHPDCTPPCAQGALVAFSDTAPCSFFAISDFT